jgi:hypothetical protein
VIVTASNYSTAGNYSMASNYSIASNYGMASNYATASTYSMAVQCHAQNLLQEVDVPSAADCSTCLLVAGSTLLGVPRPHSIREIGAEIDRQTLGTTVPILYCKPQNITLHLASPGTRTRFCLHRCATCILQSVKRISAGDARALDLCLIRARLVSFCSHLFTRGYRPV